MTNPLEAPMFKHDCRKCTFLGSYKEKYDLYFCDKGPGPTVIARFGDQPFSSLSGMIIAKRLHEEGDLESPLVQALLRAQQRGLVESKS